jgi:hypothetical protein
MEETDVFNDKKRKGKDLKDKRYVVEDEYEEDECWEPVSFRDSLKARDFNQRQCWACLYGHLVEDQEKHPAHFGLFKILSQYYGKMSNDELWHNMHQYHEHYIRKPAEDDGEECMEWPVDIIAEHVLEHMNDPAIEFGEQIKDHKAIKTMLKNKISIRNEKGDLKHDLKVIEKYIQVAKSIRELHNCKPEKCLFHDQTLKIGKPDA